MTFKDPRPCPTVKEITSKIAKYGGQLICSRHSMTTKMTPSKSKETDWADISEDEEA
jgi:hypothetical protein